MLASDLVFIVVWIYVFHVFGCFRFWLVVWFWFGFGYVFDAVVAFGFVVGIGFVSFGCLVVVVYWRLLWVLGLEFPVLVLWFCFLVFDLVALLGLGLYECGWFVQCRN